MSAAFTFGSSNTITNGSFSVTVLAKTTKKISRDDGEYIALPDNTAYELKLSSAWGEKADATVKIDGEPQGQWRVPSYGSCKVSHPDSAHGGDRAFVYRDEKSEGAAKAGVVVGHKDNGLVEVEFKPERNRSHEPHATVYRSELESNRGFVRPSMNQSLNSLGGSSAASASAMGGGFGYDESLSLSAKKSRGSTESFSSGATVLGGATGIEYGSVSAITDYDTSRITKIVFRLVTLKDEEPVAIKKFAEGIKTMSVPPRIDGDEKVSEDFM